MNKYTSHNMKWEVFADTEFCPLCQKLVNLEKVGYMGDYRFKDRYRRSICLMKLRPEIDSRFVRMYPNNMNIKEYDIKLQSLEI
jgi:hypothetical protein